MAKYTSTTLVQSNNELEIRKADLDLLSKINEVAALAGNSSSISPMTYTFGTDNIYQDSDDVDVPILIFNGTLTTNLNFYLYSKIGTAKYYIINNTISNGYYITISVNSASGTSVNLTGSDTTFQTYYTTNIYTDGTNVYTDIIQTNIDTSYYSNSSDRVLPIGKTAFYETGTTSISSLPMHIACGSGQIYTMKILHKKPQSASNLDLSLYPNNTTYSSAFYWYGFISSASALVFSASTTGSCFYWDDMSGSCNAPYIRDVTIYTGDANNSPVALQTSGGGYGSGAIGFTHYGESWNTIGVSWTSLGTLVTAPKNNYNIFITRLL